MVPNETEEVERRLVSYVESISGAHLHLEPASAERSRKLPLFLRKRYRLAHARLFGRNLTLAFETEGWDPGTVSDYRAHAEQLSDSFGTLVALVLTRVPSYQRNRLVHAGVPFIVPGSQLFLPPYAIDLRERIRLPREKARRLTPTTQSILLYHLQRERLEGIPLSGIADVFGYSRMKLSRAKEELVAANLCRTEGHGRTLFLAFAESGPRLWELARPYLSSPVRKSHWVRWDRVPPHATKAGLTALSHRTMLDDDPIATYALTLTDYRRGLGNGDFNGLPDHSQADAQVEAWGYDPRLLADEEGVDPLSLFLSLEQSDDERIQQQLDKMIGEVRWT